MISSIDDSPKLLPLMVDMKNRKVVIFGGGAVGERKAALFSRYATITVISRSFTAGLCELGKQGINLVETSGTFPDDEISGHIGDAFIVIPATSNLELNKRITDIAHDKGCLVNSVDGMEDLAVPSIIERGDITIAISTKGASPALSKFMRKKIEEAVPEEFDYMVRLLKELRPRLKQQVPRQEDRSRILWAVLEDEDVWKALSESYNQAMGIALNHISDGNK